MGAFVRKTDCDSAQLLADSRFFKANGYLPRPRLVQWLATLRCELTCPHCLAVSRDAAMGGHAAG